MSRQIDLTQPLSPEDRQYLEERADYNALEQNRMFTEGEVSFSFPGQGPGVDEEGLRKNTGDMGVQEDERVDVGVAKASDGSVGELSDNYDSLTNEQLREEIRRRNEGREERRLSTSGDKATLIATLREDDESDEEESDDE